MDAVRFGRALGFGARQAAKTVVAAVDAASAESPSGNRAAQNASGSVLSTAGIARTETSSDSACAQQRATFPVGEAGRILSQGMQAKGGLRQGSKRFRQAALGPFVRLSGVLMLELSGVFFGIFALYGLATVWRLRTEWHAGALHHREWLGGVIMLLLFGYFCVSSFIRARLRERQR